MKQLRTILTAVMMAGLVVAGCAKKNRVDTSQVEKSFQSAERGTRSGVDKAVAEIKAGNYAGALTELKSVASKAKLTPEQKQAINDLIAQVQQQLSGTANKAAGDAQKALGDVQKSLPK
jgi:outer membrane protein assembly factor BamD (BamD/ComL family)